MQRYGLILTVVLVAAGLVVSGCKREAEESTQASEASATDTEIETKMPEDVAEKIEQATKLAAAAGQGVDTADAPAYIHTIARHLKGLSKVMRENAGDCAKSLAAVNKYLEENKVDIDAMREAAKEDQEKLSDVEKMKIAQQTAAVLAPVMQEFGAAQASFAQSCPDELRNIAGALKAFQSKPE
jgi:NAD/NADP transhydrogenase beta subunit